MTPKAGTDSMGLAMDWEGMEDAQTKIGQEEASQRAR